VVPIKIESLIVRLRVPQALILIALACVAGAASAQLPGAPAPAPKFAIQQFVVEGNTLLSESLVRSVVNPFTGPSRDFGDVQRALEALQDAYSSRGYNAVRVLVPEQDIRAGSVRLQVIEARIRRVRVENNKFFSEANIRAGLPALKEGGSPNVRALGENAQMSNENPAKQVAISLESADEEAKVDALVRVTDDSPRRYSVFADNTGTPATGNYRVGVGFQHANLFNGDEILNLQAITSPGHVSDVKIVGMGFRAPMYRAGGNVDLSAGYSNVNSGVVQDLFTVSGAGRIYGLRYTQFLPRFGTYEQRLAAGWDYRAFVNNVGLIGTTAGSIVPDITLRPWSLTYTGRNAQVGRDLSFYLTFAHNAPGGPNGGQEAFDAARAGASANYSAWRYGAAYAYTLPQDYLLRAVASGQYTKNLLVPGEQFGMGGMDSVRGYHERETANDNGYRLSLEGYGPDLGSRLGSDWRVRPLIFTDMARGKDNEPARNAENRLASFGAGVRLSKGKSVSARFDVARATRDAGTRAKGDNMLQFSLAYSY